MTETSQTTLPSPSSSDAEPFQDNDAIPFESPEQRMFFESWNALIKYEIEMSRAEHPELFHAPESSMGPNESEDTYIEQLYKATETDSSEAVYERECSFFRKIYTRIQEMAEEDDRPIVLLFDMDQTISEGDAFKAVRPAFPLVVSALRAKFGDRVHIGLLSTLDDKGTQELCLANIDEAAIDRQYLIGTRVYTKSNPELGLANAPIGEYSEKVLERLEAILHPAVYAALVRGDLELDDVRDVEGKFEILLDLAEQEQQRYEWAGMASPNTHFVLIDNNVTAGMLKEGIWVGPEVHTDYLAHQRTLLPQRLGKANLSEEKLRDWNSSSV